MKKLKDKIPNFTGNIATEVNSALTDGLKVRNYAKKVVDEAKKNHSQRYLKLWSIKKH